MSIYAAPYPLDGAGQCSDIYTAESIFSIAAAVDGKEIIDKCPGLAELLESWEDDDPAHIHVKSGVGIAKLRRYVAAMWDVMSSDARELMLVMQFSKGVLYLLRCHTALTKLTGDKYRKYRSQIFDLDIDYSEMLIAAINRRVGEKPPDNPIVAEIPPQEEE